MKRLFAIGIGAVILGAAVVVSGAWAQQPASPGGVTPGHMGSGMTPPGGPVLIGLLTLGAHHQPHHLAMARGEAMPGHGH